MPRGTGHKQVDLSNIELKSLETRELHQSLKKNPEVKVESEKRSSWIEGVYGKRPHLLV